ncbi:c-type cytochrome [Inquilinus sp. NPDC058860]|uniref:c-type cytochrome n=1 Tax=Inquilinus sp. NPDC058860 TaxID=3346652 RepID=UPI0036BBBCD8
MIVRSVAAILFALLLSAAAGAQDAPMLSPASTFAETDGAALFANVCQACHMPAGQGLTTADIAERAEWTEDYAKKMVEFGRDLMRGGAHSD